MSSYVKKIRNISFTKREIDVISCVINNRGLKKVSQILLISPRTVETHIQNILLKIKGSSQEFIRDFVEKSGESSAINNHYNTIKIRGVFESQIKTLFSTLKNKSFTGKILIATADSKIDYLIKVLKLTGINIEVIKVSKQSDNRLFINTPHNIFLYKLHINNNEKAHTNNKVINLYQKQEIEIYKIFQDIFPDKDFIKYIEELNRLYANLKQGMDAKIKVIIMAILFVLGLFAITCCIFLYQYNKRDVVSYNYLLPQERILLPRQNILTTHCEFSQVR